MARLARFGNARTPTWLRTTTALNTNANAAVATKHTPVKHLPRKKKKDGQRPFARSAAPSPPSAASTGTLAAETPAPDCPLARKTSSSPSSSSSSTPPAVVHLDGDDDDDDCRRREVLCYRTCKFDIEFRLVQRRSGLLAMRRSRKARHRRERGYLAGMFRLVGVEVDDKGKGKDTPGCAGEEGAGEDGPVCWDLLEKMLDMERETTEE